MSSRLSSTDVPPSAKLNLLAILSNADSSHATHRQIKPFHRTIHKRNLHPFRLPPAPHCGGGGFLGRDDPLYDVHQGEAELAPAGAGHAAAVVDEEEGVVSGEEGEVVGWGWGRGGRVGEGVVRVWWGEGGWSVGGLGGRDAWVAWWWAGRWGVPLL